MRLDRQRNSQKAAAEHIAVQASPLVRMANANNFPLLAYLMDLAVLEAWREASGPGTEPICTRVAKSNEGVGALSSTR
jgi:hypothetical protein